MAVVVTGANRHDSIVFEHLVDAIPAVPGLSGRPRSRPDKLHADKGYDFARCRRHLRKRGISHELRAAASRRTIGSASIAGLLNALTPGLPRSASSVFVFERRLDIHLALLTLACAVICSRFAEDFC